MTIPLGTLQRLDVRQVWQHEAGDFTPWLATETGLKLLGDALGIELELEAAEKPVGPFKADILARRTDTPEDHWVLIENQLARTDHVHLGQLLTYAAGLHTATIVWIAQNFTDEHRAALDWLNEITSDKFEFYGLEIEVWRIGDSPAAPKLNLVARPNEWSREVKVASEADYSPLKLQQQRFWQGLKEHLAANKSPLRSRTARPQHWSDFSIGKAGAWLSAVVSSRDNFIGVEFNFRGPPGKLWFKELYEQRATIEAAVGTTLEWQEMPNKQSSRIAIYKRECDPTVEAEWPAQHQWLAMYLAKLHAAMRDRVRRLSNYADPVDPIETDDRSEPL